MRQSSTVVAAQVGNSRTALYSLMRPLSSSLNFVAMKAVPPALARGGFRLQSFRIDAGLGQFHNVFQLAIDPQLDRKAVEIVI